MAVKCPQCDIDNPSDSKYCKECATPLPSGEEISASPTKTVETPTEKLTRGTTFAGRYEIIEELGKGGMGKVYRVFDKKIEGEVALKLVKPEIAADKKIIERFRNELKLAREIAHRNVCRMYDLNEEKGTHYITMEYIPGEDLKSTINRVGPLGTGKAVFIAKQVCDGLNEAHRLGVVHRDLKPQNIMIDKDGNARIMDFGIARSVKGKGITGSGVMIGTPEYMSPEQVEGKEADQRSDVYSLGVILYEMVTGRAPFEGDTPFTIGVKHKSEIPQDPKELNAQIPEDLSLVILKCLEKDKEKRYQSTGEVRSELTNIEKGLPTTDRVIPTKKPATSKEITVTFNIKKLMFPAVAVAVLVIAVVLILQIFPRKGAAPILSDKPTLAIMYFKNNTGDVSLDNLRSAFSDMLITDLMKSSSINVISADKLLNILRELNLLKAESYTSDDLKKVAALGGATFILTGDYIKVGDAFRIDIVIQDTATMKYVATETVKDTEPNFLWMVDDLTKKIKTNFQLSEKDIASDSNLAGEIAGDSDFVEGAVIAKGDIKPPKIIETVPPVYPEEARQKRVDGIVVVQARADEQGNVEAVKLLRSIPLLDQAAIDAVKQWRYEPWIYKGEPTPLVFTITVTFRLRDKDKSGKQWKNSIAVLPFADLSPDKDQEYFCDGLAEELINRLTKIENLRIPARASAFSFKGKDVGIQEIGEKLNVDMILDGSVRKAGNRLRITVQLVSVADGFPVWSEMYERNVEDTFALWDEISLAVVDNLKIELLGEEKAKLMKRYTDNLEAYNLYVQGRYFWNKRTEDGLKKAIDYFEQALRLDPNYALAYAGIADAYSMLSSYDFIPSFEAMPKAKAAALKALEMDDALAEAYTSLANIKQRFDFDWLGSEENYKRAIELNPNYPLAHHWYGALLRVTGRFNEAHEEITRALELDPLSISISTSFANIHMLLGEYEHSIAQSKKTLEMNPNYGWAHAILANIYLEKAMYDEAIAEFRKAVATSRGYLSGLGYAYAVAGEKEKALEVLDELNTQSQHRYVSNYGIALVYAGLGEKDKAFEYLDKAYETRESALHAVKIDSGLESLHSNPRFKALLKKMGLE